MAFQATVVKDSMSPDDVRLTTLELTYPRIVHAEMMTHRVFSRNSASTRAIPLAVQLQNILQNPFIPEKFGINQPGMQSFSHLAGLKHDEAVEVWLQGRDRAVTTVIELILGTGLASEVLGYETHREYVSSDIVLEHFDELKQLFPKSSDDFDPETTELLNVHKQLAGRGLEAYMWHTVVLTATEFENFFALRDHPDAQGEIATIARLMKRAMDESIPKPLGYGAWHLPYVDEGEFFDIEDAIQSSVARTAATSYNRQQRKNPEAEQKRFFTLLESGHMSPFEHQGTPVEPAERNVREELKQHAATTVAALAHDLSGDDKEKLVEQLVHSLDFNGNFRGWKQLRKRIKGEHNFGLHRER